MTTTKGEAPEAHAILDRVLMGLARNRIPGYHFLGNFLHFSTEEDDNGTISKLTTGPHCVDAEGQIDLTFLGVFIDVAMANATRKALDHYGRLATLSLSLQLNGRPLVGVISARSTFHSLLDSKSRTQAYVQTELSNDDGPLGFGHTNFMIIETDPFVPKTQPSEMSPLTVDELTEQESQIYQQSVAALNTDCGINNFSHAFYNLEAETSSQGAHGTFNNGPHIDNRVGHLQGGIQLGLACNVAQGAVGDEFGLTGVTVTYMRPGQGNTFNVISRIVSKGKSTALIETVIQDSNGKSIMQASTNYSRLADT